MNFCDPQHNVLQMGLREGLKVGDFGSGIGHFALAVAPIVGNEGKVYAVDVQEDVLTRLRAEAEHRKLRNVETVWGDIERLRGTKLKDGVLDAVILSNTLFQLEHKEGAMAELKRVLKPGGTLLVVDWAGCYGGMGPAEEHIVPEHDAEALFIGAGFHKKKAFRGGPHHYSLVFTAPA